MKITELAVEFGFMCAEKGMNLNAAIDAAMGDKNGS